MNYFNAAGLVGLIGLALVGCTDEDSQKLETKEIQVSYYVEHGDSPDDPLRLRAHPYRGNSLQGVDLTDGDRIEVTTSAMPRPLVLDRGGIGGYFGNLPEGDHREVTFALVRSKKASAPASKVTIMPRVAFEVDPEGSTVSYASAGLELRWANGTPGARFELDSAQRCDTASASATTEDLPDPARWDDGGSLTIAPAQLLPAAPEPGGTCVRVALRHLLPGTVDPALQSNSSAEALQRFSFDVTVVPLADARTAKPRRPHGEAGAAARTAKPAPPLALRSRRRPRRPRRRRVLRCPAMLALLFDGAAAPRLVADRAEPARGLGEALVGVRLAGVCDTDLQLLRGYMGFRGVPGHEFVGEVLACDDARWRGRRVVADINAGCGACDDCARGRGHHCAGRTVLGIAGRDGALAERLAVPERCLVEVPDTLSDEHAVFAEPLAAALHVLDELDGLGGAAGRGPAVVLGDGKLGLLCALALRAAGVPVLLVGRHEAKLAHAARAGAEVVLEPALASRRLDASAALVVEATGSAGGLALALQLARPRATVVLKTTVAGPLQIDLAPVVINELRLVGSRCGDLARAVDVLARGEVDPTPLVAARYPLARAPEALARAGERGVLKVLVDVAGGGA